eukprot:880648-Pelagomonas_calceolata.AAC.2
MKDTKRKQCLHLLLVLAAPFIEAYRQLCLLSKSRRGAYLDLRLGAGIQVTSDHCPNCAEDPGRVDDAYMAQHLWVVVLVVLGDQS